MRKVSFAVLPSNSFRRAGSCKPGHLHQHAVGALARDRGLDRAELVDAPLDDLDRLIDRLPDALEKGGLGDGQPEQAVAGIDDFDTCARRSRP